MKLLIFASVFLLFLVNTTSANIIGVINPPLDSIFIREWTESDSIEGKDIYVNMVIKLLVNKKLLKFHDYFEFEFTPAEDYNADNLPATNVKFEVCEGSIGGYNFGEEIPINCNKNISFTNKSEIRFPFVGYKEYRLNISVEDLNWSFYDYKWIVIKINYIVPHFIEEGTEKLLIFPTSCFPDNCPTYQMIEKSIRLPPSTVLKMYPKDTVLNKQGRRLILTFNNFTPYSPYHGKYESKIVMYTDLDEERKDKRNWFLWGIIFALGIDLVVWFFIKKKKEDKIHNTVSNAKTTVNANKTKSDELNKNINKTLTALKNISKQIAELKSKKIVKTKKK